MEPGLDTHNFSSVEAILEVACSGYADKSKEHPSPNHESH